LSSAGESSLLGGDLDRWHHSPDKLNVQGRAGKNRIEQQEFYTSGKTADLARKDGRFVVYCFHVCQALSDGV
jgi:hypothetical protein